MAAGPWLVADSRSRQIRHVFMIPQLLLSMFWGPPVFFCTWYLLGLSLVGSEIGMGDCLLEKRVAISGNKIGAGILRRRRYFLFFV
jgi:hypothetical protein